MIKKTHINCWIISTIVLSFLFVFCLFYIIFNFYTKKISISNCKESMPDIKAEPTQKQDKITQELSTEDKNSSFYEKERLLLLQELRDLHATSYLFGVKIKPFHKDWDCKNEMSAFTDEGFSILCYQKPCLTDKHDLWGEKPTKECSDEINNREYPEYILPSFAILAEKFIINDPSYSGEVTNLYDSANFKPNMKSIKGIEYEFIKLEVSKEEGSLKKYQVVFYSPKRLGKELSELTGTFYGSEEIYGKYTITMNFYDYEDKISTEQIKNLVELIIDSIEFLDP